MIKLAGIAPNRYEYGAITCKPKYRSISIFPTGDLLRNEYSFSSYFQSGYYAPAHRPQSLFLR